MSDPEVPRCFGDGRYVVERVLGHGGQKVVYLVRDTALDRQCALAVVRTEGISENRLTRVRREARAMGRLGTHPNIVTVHDVGEHEGTPFMVCEYVSGGDLASELEQHAQLDPGRVRSIAVDLCKALAYAHERGVIHRDMKPANVWLTADGHAKLGDFGLALAVGQPRLTDENAIVGTPYYLAPEQALTGNADHRTDLYGLGCVLYELLVGRPPFRGATVAEVVAQHIRAAPERPSQIAPHPDPSMDGLVLWLLEKDPDGRPQSADEVLAELERSRSPEPAAKSTLSRFERTTLAGRKSEMNELEALFDRTIEGGGGTCAISGEAGIGKSRLVRELRTYARLHGARVLTGYCDASDAGRPYLPFVEALDPVTDALPADLPAARTAARILPGLEARLPPGGDAGEAEPDRYAIFRAVGALLRWLSGDRGLLLVIEDIHWADKGSLLLLEYLARNVDESGVMIVTTYRDVEVTSSHVLTETMSALRRHATHHRLALRTLNTDTARHLVTSLSSLSDSTADAIVERTGGHPLFIEEILKHLSEEGILEHLESGSKMKQVLADAGVPEGIRDVIERRLSRLSEACSKMLGVASGSRATIQWEVLVEACGGDEDELLDCLDEALGAQILRERKIAGTEAYEFTHALTRQTLYENLSAPRRARLHRRLGNAIEAAHAKNLEPHTSELAFHFLRASSSDDDRSKAVDYATRAGVSAVAKMAYEDGVIHYGRALEALEGDSDAEGDLRRSELLGLRGLALSTLALWAEALVDFEAATSCLPSGPEHRERRARLLLRIARCRFWTKDLSGLSAAASEAASIAEEIGDTNLAAAARAFIAHVGQASGEIRSSHEQYARAAREAGEVVDPLVGLALQNYPMTLYWLGRCDEAVEIAERLLRVARAEHDGAMLMSLLPITGLALAGSGRYREALALFDEAQRFGYDHKIDKLAVRATAMSIGPHVELSDLDLARSLAEDTIARAERLGFAPPVVAARMDVMFIAIEEQDVDAADALLPELREAVAAAGGWHGWIWSLRFALARALLASAKGRHEDACAEAASAIAQAQATGRLKYEALARTALGRARHALGQEREGIEELRRGVRLAESISYPALLVRSAAELLDIEPDEGVVRLGAQTVDSLTDALDGLPSGRAFAASRRVRLIRRLAT